MSRSVCFGVVRICEMHELLTERVCDFEVEEEGTAAVSYRVTGRRQKGVQRCNARSLKLSDAMVVCVDTTQ